MNHAAIERLKDYLAQLAPPTQALLAREFERELAGGDNVAVAHFVLAQLRQVAPIAAAAVEIRVPPGTHDDAFPALRSFLVDEQAGGKAASLPGQIRDGALAGVWSWLGREGAPEAVQVFEASRSAAAPGLPADEAATALATAAADAIAGVLAIADPGERQRALARVAPVEFADDLSAIVSALRAADLLDALARQLPRNVPDLETMQVTSLIRMIDRLGLQTTDALPFALSLVMQRLAEPWQIIRMAVAFAGSDAGSRVAASPYGVAISMVLGELRQRTSKLQNLLKRGLHAAITDDLQFVHDGVRGLRTELDLRSDSLWSKQLASICKDASDALSAEINSAPGRVRRLLRQRLPRDIAAGARIDPAEVDAVAALIAFIAACRSYAGELAINEVTLRTFSELQAYVEYVINALVQSLRHDDASHEFRSFQADTAIRFCTPLFGEAYAILMRRAADNAIADAHQAAKAG